MKVKILHTGLALVAAFTSTLSIADALPEWVSSYNVNGSCYCTPSIHPSLKNKIVPTPVGGQSISQVCTRVGQGPGLVLEAGVFNYPAYHDAQCGNGPYGADPQGCEGRMEVDDTICTGSGPEWDLKSAYARPARAEPETAVVQNSRQQRPAKVQAKARDAVRSDQEDAKLALELAAKARAKIEQQNRLAEQQRSSVLPENTNAENTNAEKSKELELAKQQAQQQVQQQRDAQARLARQQAAEQELARQRAAKARAALVQVEREARLKQNEQTGNLAAGSDAEQSAPQIKEKPGAAETVPAGEIATAPSIADAVDDETMALNRLAASNADKQLKPVAEHSATEQQLVNAAAVGKIESSAEPGLESATGTAVRIPAALQGNSGGFIEVAPLSYDFGGTGASLAGGLPFGSGWQLGARAAVAQEYTEVMLGVRKILAPESLKGVKLQLLGGLEYGNFDLGVTDLVDSGVLLGGALLYQLNSKTNLAAGVNYSSFFEGDPAVFGHLLYRLVDNLDFSSRVEGGDNANLSLGLRYHY